MSKICIVGDYDSICAFGVLGIDTYPLGESEDISKKIEKLIENDYCIILITVNIADKITALTDKYRTRAEVSIVPVPSVVGDSDLGMQNLYKAVEQAVGSAEMIFGEM